MENVSLVLPNHNHGTELRTSLGCIVGQTRPFDEIIVVDDASTDDSLSVLEEFRAGHENLTILRNDTQLGVARTVNRGLAAATGKYVILASADERIAPEMCETLLAVALANPDARLVVSRYSDWHAGSGAETTHDEQSPLGMWFVRGSGPQSFTPDEFRSLLKQRFVWLGVNTALFDRRTLVDCGGFDPALRWHSDWFAIYSIAFRHGFCAVPRALAWFYVTEHSYSATGMRDEDAQRSVIGNMLAKLETPEHADMLAALKEAPSALSPFVRTMIPVLAGQPRRYPLLLPLSRWWFGEMLKGRRPGALARLVDRVRAKTRD